MRLIAQRIGQRHWWLPDQRLRIRRRQVLVFIRHLGLLGRRIERHPSQALQFDFHPSGDIVAGEFDFGAIARGLLRAGIGDFAILVFRQEAQDHTGGQSQITSHQCHGGGILLGVAHHGRACQQLVDAVVAMAGIGGMVAFKSMREPSGVFQCVSQRRGCGTARGLPAGNGRGQFAGRIGNILGFWLGDAGRSRTADLLIGGLAGDNAGFGIGEAFTRAGGNNGGIGIRVVVKRVIAVVGIVGEAHASGRSRQRQPGVGQSLIDGEGRSEGFTLLIRLDRGAHAMIIRGVRGFGRIGQVPYCAIESIHHRKFDRCSGRQIMNGQQHVFFVVLDIGSHAAERAGVIVGA